jgi:hypothetical protein
MSADSAETPAQKPIETKPGHEQERPSEPSLIDFRDSDIRKAWDIKPVSHSPVTVQPNDGSENAANELTFDTLKLFGNLTSDRQPVSRAARQAAGADRGISDNATEDQRTDFMADRHNRLAFNLDTIWSKDNRVLAIGDQHLTSGIKQHTIANMEAYAKAGATAIGLESLPKGSQPLVDAYEKLRRENPAAAKDSNERKAVEQLFRDHQAGPEDQESEQGEKAIAENMALLDAAIDAGLHPIAIEPNISNAFASNRGFELMHRGMEKLPESKVTQEAFETYTNPRSSDEQRADARQTLQNDLKDWSDSDKFFDAMDEARNAGFDFSGIKIPPGPEGEDKQWHERLHDLRNRTWTEQTADYLHNNPEARMLLFAGSQHFQYGQRDAMQIPSANERLQEKGIGTTVLQFAGGEFGDQKTFDSEMTNAIDHYRNLNKSSGATVPETALSAALRYTRPAQSANVSDQEFTLRIARDNQREADYIVHLPQKRD